MRGMHTRFALITAGTLALTGLGLISTTAAQKAPAAAVVVYKSPT